MLEGIWFFLWGILWAVYFMLDGFDFGIGSLMPVLARSDRDKRIMLNSMGPFWDGNEVWLITAGGVTFAAFPRVYAVLFSALYAPLMVILFCLIFRGVSIEFRGELESKAWRTLWDSCMVASSSLAAFLFGVFFSNLFSGIPIDGNGVYHGTFAELFSPYALLGGCVFLSLFLVHGSLWLTIKAGGEIEKSASTMARRLWPVQFLLILAFFSATAFNTELVENYLRQPLLFIVPVITLAGLVASRLCMQKGWWWRAWFGSGVGIAGVTMSGITGLYPNLLVSSLDSSFSLTCYNSAASTLTLKIMLAVVGIFIPIVITYQSCVYYFFRRKITESDLAY